MPSKRSTKEGGAQRRLDPPSSGLGDRISQVLDLYPTLVRAAETAAISDDMLRAYAKEKNEPPFAVLARLATPYGVSLDWLWSGKGTMRRDAPDPGEMSYIRELDVRAVSGVNGGLVEILKGQEDEHTKAVYGFPSDRVVELFGGTAEGLCILEVIGNSMEPELMAGSRVVVDTRDRSPTPPGVRVLWDGFGVLLKRVEMIMKSDPPTIRISSANPAYATFELTLGEAHILGRVVGRFQRT